MRRLSPFQYHSEHPFVIPAFSVIPAKAGIWITGFFCLFALSACAAGRNVQLPPPPPPVTDLSPVIASPPTVIASEAKQSQNYTNKKVIRFRFDGTEILPKYEAALKEVAHFLKEQPQSVALITGHTCSYGEDIYNEILGEERARAIKVFLRDEGVDYKRLVVVSKGEHAPYTDGQRFADHQQNRRVEIEVTLLDQ